VHDADRATLDLLVHQSRQLEGMRFVGAGHVSARPGEPAHVDGPACFGEGTCLPAKGPARLDKYLPHSCLHTHFW
jgi:hypothetical protein